MPPSPFESGLTRDGRLSLATRKLPASRVNSASPIHCPEFRPPERDAGMRLRRNLNRFSSYSIDLQLMDLSRRSRTSGGVAA